MTRPNLEWMTAAACRGDDPARWVPDPRVDVDAQKAVCAGCPVALACLEYGLTIGDTWAIYGGYSADERRRLLRRARRDPMSVPAPFAAHRPVRERALYARRSVA